MRFYETNIKNFTDTIDKLERFFAYKYEVRKEQVALIIKAKVIHVLIDGKVKESFRHSAILKYGIDETTCQVIKIGAESKNAAL